MITRIKVITNNLGEERFFPQRKVLFFWIGIHVYNTSDWATEDKAREVISNKVIDYLARGTARKSIILD